MNTPTLHLACVLAVGALFAGCFSGTKPDRAVVSPASTSAGVTPTQSAPTQGALTGTVMSSGEPVERAFIIAVSKDDGLVPASINPSQLFSRAGGAFTIDLPPGEYEITAVGEAGAKTTSSVSLGPNGATLDLELTINAQAVEDLVRRGPRAELSEEAR